MKSILLTTAIVVSTAFFGACERQNSSELSEDLRKEIFHVYLEAYWVAELAIRMKEPFAPLNSRKYAFDVVYDVYKVENPITLKIIDEGEKRNWFDAAGTEAKMLFIKICPQGRMPTPAEIQRAVFIGMESRKPKSFAQLLDCIKTKQADSKACALELANLGESCIQPVIQALLEAPSVDSWTPHGLHVSAGIVLATLSPKSELAERTIQELITVLYCATAATSRCKPINVAGISVEVIPGFLVSPALVDKMLESEAIMVKVSRTLREIAKQPGGHNALHPHLNILEQIHLWTEHMPSAHLHHPEWRYLRDRMKSIVADVRG